MVGEALSCLQKAWLDLGFSEWTDQPKLVADGLLHQVYQCSTDFGPIALKYWTLDSKRGLSEDRLKQSCYISAMLKLDLAFCRDHCFITSCNVSSDVKRCWTSAVWVNGAGGMEHVSRLAINHLMCAVANLHRHASMLDTLPKITWLERFADRLKYWHSLGLIPKPLMPVKDQEMMLLAAELGTDDLVFCHHDWHPGNVLWQNGHIAGLLDWECAQTLDRTQAVASISLSWSIRDLDVDLLTWQACWSAYRLYHPIRYDKIKPAIQLTLLEWLSWACYLYEQALVSTPARQTRALGCLQRVCKTVDAVYGHLDQLVTCLKL